MTQPGELMAGKKGLIMGVANDRSLGWGIARALHAHGAEIAFTYAGDALEKRVRPLAESLGSDMVFPCDVADEASIDALFDALKDKWGELDFYVHSIGYSDKEQLRGRYVDTTLDNFLQTMHISCFSFVSVAQRAARMMKEGGSMLTLSYYGAEKVIPHYNVMGVAKAALEASVRYVARDLGCDGIRANAISAGAVKTLAASGVGDFRFLMKWYEYNSPLKRNITIDQVGGAALYLLSDLSAGVTGEVHYVDSGYNIMGMKAEDAPDLTLE